MSINTSIKRADRRNNGMKLCINFIHFGSVVYVNNFSRSRDFPSLDTFLKMPFSLLTQTKFYSSGLRNSNFIQFTTFTPTHASETCLKISFSPFAFQSTFMLLSFTLTIDTKCEKINFSSRSTTIFFRGTVEEKCLRMDQLLIFL